MSGITSSARNDPVAAFIGFLLIFSSIYFFDKWVVRGAKSHHSHALLDKESSLGKRTWHSFLWMVEFFCSIYLLRGIRTNGEPFRKATEKEKRLGGLFMVLFPLLMVLVMSNTKSIDPVLDSMISGRHSIVWLYAGYIATIFVGVVFAIYVAPRIPLAVSAPLAVLSWAILVWFVFARKLV